MAEEVDLLKGMKNRSPKDSDSSMSPKPDSINSDPVRTSVATTPKTLGPRTA